MPRLTHEDGTPLTLEERKARIRQQQRAWHEKYGCTRPTTYNDHDENSFKIPNLLLARTGLTRCEVKVMVVLNKLGFKNPADVNNTARRICEK